MLRINRRAELIVDRHIGGIPAIGHHKACSAGLQLSGIKGIPATAHIGFKSGKKIHGLQEAQQIAHRHPRHNAEGETLRDSKVGNLPTDTLARLIGFYGRQLVTWISALVRTEN